MKNNPQVAIMMPVYNGEKTLPLAIKSLQAQTYQNWKCYIVNDGSTDKTKEILDKIAIEDDRFVVHHFSENKGRPYARQKALDLAEGKYLAFLDADDFFHPKKIQMQLETFERFPEVDLVSCGMGSFDNGFNLLTVKGNKEHEPTLYRIVNHYYPARTPCMVRLSLAKTIKYNLKLKYTQDTDYFTRYINNKKYMVTSDVLYYYSEFSSVDSKKILKSYLYGANRGLSIFKNFPLAGAKLVILSFMKWGYMLIKTQFVSHDDLIKSRGHRPSKQEELEFSRVKNLLNVEKKK